MGRVPQIQEYLNRAWTLRGKSDYKKSKKVLKEAEAICGQDDYFYQGWISHVRMQYLADEDEYEKALPYCKKSIEYYTKDNNPDRIAHSTRHLADLYMKLGKPEMARELYEEAIKIYRGHHFTQDEDLANALQGYAWYLEKADQFDKALTTWKEVLYLYTKHEFEEGIEISNKKIKDLTSLIS